MKRRMVATIAIGGSMALGALGGAVLFAPLSSLAADTDRAADERTTDDCELQGPIASHLEVAADTIGIDASALLERIRDGETIADVAEAEGVEVDAVIDAMVSDARSRLDEAVADDRLTERQARLIARDMQERITAMVNGEFLGPDGFGGFHHHRGAMGWGPGPW
jgi:hypothetical protein